MLPEFRVLRHPERLFWMRCSVRCWKLPLRAELVDGSEVCDRHNFVDCAQSMRKSFKGDVRHHFRIRHGFEPLRTTLVALLLENFHAANVVLRRVSDNGLQERIVRGLEVEV